MRRAGSFILVVVFACASSRGQSVEKVLYNFGTNPNDGVNPAGSLAADSKGNLYGVTQGGGLGGFFLCDGAGCGTVFELSRDAGGNWNESVIYDFCASTACPNGELPNSGLTTDSDGNLYGVTPQGGAPVPTLCVSSISRSGCGVAYELSPPSIQGGAWTYTLLYTFCSVVSNQNCDDGDYPNGPLISDASGNFYGTTEYGGENNYGAVFELSPSSGVWTESILYSFCPVQRNGKCLDAIYPSSKLTFDASGNLYGTTSLGYNENGAYGGALFKLSPSSTGWTESILTTFSLTRVADGYSSSPGPVSIDSAGRLYTSLALGGDYSGSKYGYGRIVRLNAGHKSSFLFDGADGYCPQTGVLLSARKQLAYGTSSFITGGYDGNIFAIDPLGQETVLYDFCQNAGCTDGVYPQGPLIEDDSGNLYGVTQQGGASYYGVVFELSP